MPQDTDIGLICGLSTRDIIRRVSGAAVHVMSHAEMADWLDATVLVSVRGEYFPPIQ